MTFFARLLLTSLLAPALLAGCGRADAPDEPLYTIDTTSPAAAADPGLAGCWTGALETGVEARTIVLSVSLDPARVRLISPDQGGAAVAFEQVRVDGPRLAAATRLGAFRFDLALDGADRLAGDAVQGGLTDTIVFERSGPSDPAC